GGFDPVSTSTATVNGGIATFGNLVFDTAGNYTLGESATGGLNAPNSVVFTIVPAALDHLTWRVQPSDTTAGIAISPAVQVAEFDRFGNLGTLDNGNRMTLSVAGGPDAFASESTTTLIVGGGVGTFDNVVFDTAGVYILGVHAANVAGPNSNS